MDILDDMGVSKLSAKLNYSFKDAMFLMQFFNVLCKQTFASHCSIHFQPRQAILCWKKKKPFSLEDFRFHSCLNSCMQHLLVF